MAIFDPKNIPVISKLVIGENTYYLKDAEVRALLATLGTAAQKDVATGVSASEQGLVTGAQVQAAIAGISGSMHFRGVVTELPAKAEDGDVYIVGTKEYVWANGAFHELGDETLYALKSITIGTQDLSANINLNTLFTDMGLKALAKKDSATGTVAGQTISGLKASGTTAGSIDVALTQTSTAASLTKSSYTPSGTIEASVTPTGAVSIAKDATNGTQISGSVSAPTITVIPNTTGIRKIASVGTLPSKASDTFTANGDDKFTQGSQAEWSASVDDNETLSFSFTANTLPTFKQGTKASYIEGKFESGTLPSLEEEATTVVTGIKSATASAPTFTGDKFSASFTGAESEVSSTFNGTATQIVTGVNYDKAGVDTAATKFTGAAIELAVDDVVVVAKEVTVS